MTDKSSKVVPFGILIGIVAGAALGAVIPGFMLAIEFIGRLFINALQVVVIPLIVAAIISGVAAFGDLRKIGRTGSRIILYFAATSAIAVVIGLVLALVIKPGAGASSEVLRNFGQSGGYPIGNVSDMLSALLPFNLASGIAGGQYLGLILFSIIAGGVLATMGAGARTVTTFFRQLNDVVSKLVRLLLLAAPVGVFSLVGSAVAANSNSIGGLTQGFGWYALTILIGLAVQAFVILPIIAVRFTGRSPIDYLRDLSPALMTALGTGSSAATLPVTYKCAVDDGRVDQRAGALVLPLGAVANLNGTAMSVVIATLFLANVFDITLSALQIAVMVVTTLLVSIGAAGMPMATPVITTIVLGVAGFTPVQILAGTSLIVALDWLVDRGRAVVNVWGDAVGVAVIAETFEFKTARRVPSRERDSARPRTSTRSDRGRGRTRSDSRATRKPDRSPAGTRDRRGSRPTSEKPAPPARGGRGRVPQRAAESESPFGITAPSTPMLDVEGVSPQPVESSKPEPVADRRPQRSRSRDEGPKSGGTRQRDSATDRGRSRRPERDATDSPRTSRRPATRERKPVARKVEDVRPQPRRESRPPVSPVEDPHTPISAPKPQQAETPATATPVESAASNGRLSPATVARELAKVSAQLAISSAGEETTKPARETRPETISKEQRPEPKAASVASEPSKAPPVDSDTETSDRSFPPSSVAVKVSAPPPQKAAPSETPVPKTEPASAPVSTAPSHPERADATEGEKPSFGRSRSRRGLKPDRDEVPKKAGADDGKTDLPTGYTTESVSFGRGKKKRVR